MLKRMKLRTKLTLLMVFLTLVSVGSVGGLSLVVGRNLLMEGIEQQGQDLIAGTAYQIEGFLSGQGRVVETFAQSSAVGSLDAARLAVEIPAILANNKLMNALYFSDEATGTTIIYVREGDKFSRWQPPAGFDARTRDWYADAKAKNGLIYSQPYKDVASQGLVITIAAPVHDAAGKLLGVVGSDVSLASLSSAVGDVAVGQSGFAFLIDKTGLFLAHPDQALLGTNITEVDGLLAELGQEMMSGTQGSDQYPYLGDAHLVYYRPVPSVGWSLAVSIPKAEVHAPVASLLTSMLVIGGIVLLITVILSALFARRVVGPIQVVGSQLGAIAQGRGDLTQHIAYTTEDEVGSLARWFNAFTDKLSQIIGSVAESARAVREQAAQVEAAVGQQTEVTGQMASLMADVAQGAQQQDQAVQTAQEATRELHADVKEIEVQAKEQAATAEECRRMAQEMSRGVQGALVDIRSLSAAAASNAESAGKGHEAVRSVVESMSQIQQGMSATLTTVQGLDAGSREIGAIVEAISGIASQTNLLALNAAIEAARAGENGRGFAVVADEVRSLAEKSRQSATEIASIIDTLSGSISNTVSAVQAAEAQVSSGSRLATEAGELLEVIQTGARQSGQSAANLLDLVQTLEGQGGKVEAAMAELSQAAVRTTDLSKRINGATERISGVVAQVSRISQAHAASAEEGAASAQELNAALEEMSATAEHLAQSAGGLLDLVGQFRV